jgi:peptidase M24-like protein
MNPRPLPTTHRPGFPQVLPMRQRAEVIRDALEIRLNAILPEAMRETGFDMWVILCQEDDLDPIFRTLIPMDTWCPILQMLILTDRGAEGVERINLSMTRMQGLYDKPWSGQRHEEQWPVLAQIVEQRDPQRIGVNTGAIQWAAGGLTHNLHTQLVQALPPRYADRLTSAEPLATRWLATLTDNDLVLYEHVVDVAHALLAECYSRRAIVPNVTTTDDLEWFYWQRAAEMGLEMAFKPFFNLVRSQDAVDRFGAADRVIRPGDLIHSDVGIRYLRLNSDHQEWCYVLRKNETDAPEGIRKLMAEGNRLQDVFMGEFQRGLAGNQLLNNILTRARAEGIPQPRVYSHSLGLFLHEPGPLIGLPWEQERCEGRGEVKLAHGQCFTMELSVSAPIAEWDGQEVRMSLEEDVSFTEAGCRPVGGRQTAFYLI